MILRATVALIAFVPPLAAASRADAQIGGGNFADLGNETVLSGYVGSSFGGELDDQSVNFGGSLSWLWRSALSAEHEAGTAGVFDRKQP